MFRHLRWIAALTITISLAATGATLASDESEPLATELDTSGLQSDITEIDQEIADAESSLQNLSGGLLSKIIQTRVETLKLTRAILENRIATAEGGANIEIVVPNAQPDQTKAAEILEDIQAQAQVIAIATAEAEDAAGLVGALARSRVETEKLSLATLKASWFQAKYGVIFPALTPNPENVPNQSGDPNIHSNEKDEVKVSWADPRYTQIDYTKPIFEQLHREKFKISDWWGILETRAKVDDSLQIFAINVSAFKTGIGANKRRLTVACNENSPSVIYDTKDYLLTDYSSDYIATTYRIGTEEAVTQQWSKLTSNEGSGLFGTKAEAFIRKIYDAPKLFLRIVDRNGKRHDEVFDLAGSKRAFDEVAAACGFSTIELSSEDFRTIQSMLNAAGFDAGTADGRWGNDSASAMKQYQQSVGLAQTGIPDRETLKQMGLFN